MTEEEARAYLSDVLSVPRGTLAELDRYVTLLRREAATQNLVSASTIDTIWARHIVDSAQLLPLAAEAGAWIDLGAGAGFPGLVIAAISRLNVTLVEPRRKRAAFLAEAIDLLGVGDRAELVAARAEMLPPRVFATICARAFAPLERIFAVGERFAASNTRWVLPKGRSAQAELDAAQRTWQGEFRIEPSITDPESAIVIAEQVRPRKQR